jgi:hypothetical protein
MYAAGGQAQPGQGGPSADGSTNGAGGGSSQQPGAGDATDVEYEEVKK